MDWSFWWVLLSGVAMGGAGVLAIMHEVDLARRQERADEIYAREVEAARRRHPAYRGGDRGGGRWDG